MYGMIDNANYSNLTQLEHLKKRFGSLFWFVSHKKTFKIHLINMFEYSNIYLIDIV